MPAERPKIIESKVDISAVSVGWVLHFFAKNDYPASSDRASVRQLSHPMKLHYYDWLLEAPIGVQPLDFGPSYEVSAPHSDIVVRAISSYRRQVLLKKANFLASFADQPDADQQNLLQSSKAVVRAEIDHADQFLHRIRQHVRVVPPTLAIPSSMSVCREV